MIVARAGGRNAGIANNNSPLPNTMFQFLDAILPQRIQFSFFVVTKNEILVDTKKRIPFSL